MRYVTKSEVELNLKSTFSWGFPCFMSTECFYSKMGVNRCRIKSPAVTERERTLATKKITTKIGGCFTERLVTTPEGGTQRNFLGKVDF